MKTYANDEFDNSGQNRSFFYHPLCLSILFLILAKVAIDFIAYLSPSDVRNNQKSFHIKRLDDSVNYIQFNFPSLSKETAPPVALATPSSPIPNVSKTTATTNVVTPRLFTGDDKMAQTQSAFEEVTLNLKLHRVYSKEENRQIRENLSGGLDIRIKKQGAMTTYQEIESLSVSDLKINDTKSFSFDFSVPGVPLSENHADGGIDGSSFAYAVSPDEKYSGLILKIDDFQYKISLVNGPFQGIDLYYVSEDWLNRQEIQTAEQQVLQEDLAKETQIEARENTILFSDEENENGNVLIPEKQTDLVNMRQDNVYEYQTNSENFLPSSGDELPIKETSYEL